MSPQLWKVTVAVLLVTAAAISYLSGSAFLAPLFALGGIAGAGFLVVTGVRSAVRRSRS